MMVALLAIGLGVVLEVDATNERREKEQQLLAIGREFRSAIDSYYRETSPAGIHEYPEQLEGLLLDQRGAKPIRHLRRIYTDPMTGKTTWGLVRLANQIVAVHSFSDQAPIRKNGFEADEVGFADKKRYRDWLFGPPVNHSP